VAAQRGARLQHFLQSSQGEERRYAAILEQMSDAVATVDQQAWAELVNSAFERCSRW